MQNIKKYKRAKGFADNPTSDQKEYVADRILGPLSENAENGPEDFDPKTGRYNGEVQRENNGRPKGKKAQRGNDSKWENKFYVTFIKFKKEKAAFETYWNIKIVHMCCFLYIYIF